MAKLGAYYGLCPLIDHKSLLGITQDEESGVVIVTLGKNIAIKFKLLDQKQLYSWRTKEKFSSPIIYDKEQSQYVAVFNESFVRLWSGNEEFLDKLKKIKFNQQIHTIFLSGGKSFIVFKNGAVYLLKKAIEHRKNLTPVKVVESDSECIEEVLYHNLNEETYVGFVTNSNEQSKLYWTKFNKDDQQDKYYIIPFTRNGVDLRGCVFYADHLSVYFLSLWGDGRVYSAKLKDSDLDLSHLGELLTVVESLSCKDYISMIALDHNYLAMYGCNSNEEGALLIIYNIQFKVVQSKQSFKLFTNGAKLWLIDGNLFFPVGQNLAVVPFYLDTEQLAALVGSHNPIGTDPDPDVAIVQKVEFVNWGKKLNLKEDQMPKKIKAKIEDCLFQGHSENVTFETLLPELLEHKDVEMLTQAIHYFTDIPENSLVKVLKLILNLETKAFKKNTPSKLQNIMSVEKAELVDYILSKPFNETLLLPQLRSLLTLDEILMLLQYITFLFSQDEHSLPSLNYIETEDKLIQWSCVVLDSNYQKLLLMRDGKINEVLVFLRDLIKEQLSYSEDMRQIGSLLCELKKGKNIYKKMHMAGLDYSVEEFPLY